MNEAQLQTSTAAFQTTPRTQQGLTFTRRFSTEGVSPYDELQWEHRIAAITDTKGNTIFEQKDVEVPADWSMTATNIVASKYLHGQMNTPERETGVRQLVGRVAETVRDWGIKGGYFATPADSAIFFDELSHLLLTQKAAFNSPVWFNVGCDRLEPDADGQNWHWDPVTGGPPLPPFMQQWWPTVAHACWPASVLALRSSRRARATWPGSARWSRVPPCRARPA